MKITDLELAELKGLLACTLLTDRAELLHQIAHWRDLGRRILPAAEEATKIAGGDSGRALREALLSEITAAANGRNLPPFAEVQTVGITFTQGGAFVQIALHLKGTP